MPTFAGRTLTIWLVTASLFLPLGACRKPAEAGKSELREAGYTMTGDDWLRAASLDDVAALEKFLAAGFDPATTNAAGDTALHAAARAGAMKSADLLLDRGLAIDAAGAGGNTALMSAVLGNQTQMTAWLLRQGADPRLKNAEGYNALTLAVRENATGPLAEIAPYHRDSLDSALLLAALTGREQAIDTLTNYGASVYARMDDGRSPLMLAAENGHAAAVELLLDIGASRFSKDEAGFSAAELATAAGHEEIATLILRPPQPDELVFESPEEIAQAMDAQVAEVHASALGYAVGDATSPRPPVRPIEGMVIEAAIAARSADDTTVAGSAPDNPSAESAPPPLVMRLYRQRELPVEVRAVSEEQATLAILGGPSREVTVRPGERIPGSGLVVVRVRQRVQDSKLNLGQSEDVSVVEVRDENSGTVRNWITGLPARSHEPVALVEDATGNRFTATAGQKFRTSDGSEFSVIDVRPNQLVLENTTTGAVHTLALQGPLG